MDFKTLLPDFNAIGKTDWAKPDLKIDTKDTFKLVALAGAVLMLVFLFLSWTSITMSGTTGTKMGLATWYGIFALIMTLGAIVGILYNHNSLTFSCAVLAVVFGIIGMCSIPDMTVEGTAFTSDQVKALIKAQKEAGKAVEVSHLGAILFTVASVVTAAGAYLKITKK